MAMRPSTRMQLAKAAREQNMGGRKMEFEYERWDDPQQRGNGTMEMRRGRRGGARSEMEMEGGRMNYGSNSRYAMDDEMDMEMRRGGGRGNSGGRGRNGARSDMDMEMEMGGYGPDSRFRDRRGREHYDNGRFAPMRSSYAPYGPYGDDGPFGHSEGGSEMREIGFNANWGNEMRMGADASIPRYNEMERMPGNHAMMGGYMAHNHHGKLDEQTAMEWVRSMKNEDGSKSPHWSMEQTKQVMKQKAPDLEPAEFFAIMNALFSDFDPVFKKHGVSHMDFYVDMTKAWLKDKDAVDNKAMAYYECIVKK